MVTGRLFAPSRIPGPRRHLVAAIAIAAWCLGAPAATLAQSAAPAPVRTDGLLPEPAAIGRAVDLASRARGGGDDDGAKNGWYPELGNMITGAGWISLGPGYRHSTFGNRALVTASAAVSWRTYKMVHAGFDMPTIVPRVSAGAHVRWQDLTQVSYFGEGPASLNADRSEYRLRSASVVGYSIYRPVPPVAVEGRIGWLTRPAIDGPTGTFKRGNPATAEVFPDDPVFGIPQQPAFVHAELSMTADTRDRTGYPTRGGLYRGAVARYAASEGRTFGFERYEAEGAHFTRVRPARTVMALHGWLVGTRTGGGRLVPFYLMPSLGGANTLRAFSDYRFHDRALLLLNAEARVAVFTHVDAAAFVDAGNVGPRVADLNLDRRSYGVGVRVHGAESTLVRVDVARGTEGWRVVFRMNEVFRFARLSRQTAAVPFVP